jgi:hypothetical protein
MSAFSDVALGIGPALGRAILGPSFWSQKVTCKPKFILSLLTGTCQGAPLAVDSGGPAMRWIDLMLDSDWFRGAWWGWMTALVTMLLYLLFQA